MHQKKTQCTMYGKKVVQFIFIAHDLLPVREWIQILELTFF